MYTNHIALFDKNNECTITRDSKIAIQLFKSDCDIE